MPTSPLYLNIDLEGFHEPSQPGCAGLYLVSRKGQVAGHFLLACVLFKLWEVLTVYTCISLLSAGSHSCVCGVVGVNSPNPLQGKSNGLAKTEYVNSALEAALPDAGEGAVRNHCRAETSLLGTTELNSV